MLGKIFEQYGTTLTEVIDFSKDVYYCYSVNHVDENITILLWVFAIGLFSYEFLYIITMTKNEYIYSYGDREFIYIEERKYKHVRFTILKI